MINQGVTLSKVDKYWNKYTCRKAIRCCNVE